MTLPPSLPRPAPDLRPILGEHVELERTGAARHCAGLWRAIGADEALWRCIPPGPFLDEAAFRAWLGERVRQPGSALYTILLRQGGSLRIAGLFLLLQVNPAMGTAELGLVYGPALSRRPAGTEAFYLLARHVFETLKYRRLEWRCAAAHEASRRAARRFGFTEEGVLRQQMWVKGANSDTVVHSIIDGEWPALTKRFEGWLAPGNFDEAGQQRRALSGWD